MITFQPREGDPSFDRRDPLLRIADSLEQIASCLSNGGVVPTFSPMKDKDQSQTLDEFASYYFEKFRWRKVSAATKRTDVGRYRLHILPALGDKPLCDVTADDCQSLIDGLSGKHKTQYEVKSLLSIIFKAAIRFHIVKENPCDILFVDKYEKQHGKALTGEEIKRLFDGVRGTPSEPLFALALFTGLRPNEYKTARVEGGFVVARNSKQKDGFEHTKRVPVIDALTPYVDRIPSDVSLKRARQMLAAILPSHKLYDLRTTFYTKCQECGVSEVARKLFVGHSLGGLADTYTDVSDEYLITEASKLRF